MHHRREVDGLRALAVLPVMLFHAGFDAFSGGFVGVDVFFVISGYLITAIILDERQAGTFTPLGFYERRARRLLPALFVVLAACGAFAWAWMLPHDMKVFSQGLAAVSVFASNILLWRTSGYFEPDGELNPLLHTWSLAVEEQFYLLFPFILLAFWRLGRGWTVAAFAVIAGISLMVAQQGAVAASAAAFYLLPSRAWELLLGALVTLAHRSAHATAMTPRTRETGAAAGLALLIGAFAAFDRSTPSPGLAMLVPTLGTALILLCATPSTVVGRWLGQPALVGIGLISYAAYLWHQPLLAFARYRSVEPPEPLALALLLGVALLLAGLSWRFVETPLRDRRRFTRRQVFAGSAAGALLLLMFGLAGHVTQGGFHRPLDPAVQLIEAAARERGKNAECRERLARNRSLADACVLGTSERPPAFAIVGDSQAGAIVGELSAAARRLDLAGRDFSYDGCPPLLDGRSSLQGEVQVVCNTLRADLREWLATGRLPRTLIVFSRWALRFEKTRFDNQEGGVEAGTRASWVPPDPDQLGHSAALRQSVVRSVQALLDQGHRVVLIYPTPEMGWNVPARLHRIHLARGTIGPADASTSYPLFETRNRQAIDALDAIGEHPGLVRIKPAELFCNTVLKGRCAAHLEGAPLYADDDHLSDVGARMLVGEIAKSLGP